VAKNVNIEKIIIKVEGVTKLGKLSSTFAKLNKNIGLTPKELNKTIKSITAYDRRGQRSVNTFNRQIAALKQLKDNVGIGGAAYKKLGGEIDRLRAKMDNLTNSTKKQSAFQKLGAGFKAGGGAALTGAVGRFLPPSAQVGGAAGFIKGGVPGAIAGGAIGLGVDAVAGGVKFASEAATYASEIKKLRIALKGVTKDQATFDKGLSIITETSKKLNVPIAASTKQFTTLAASVLGSGGTIKDAEEVFTGVSNAIKATGGNAEDVQSAIRAMSQIFGKGKVSAEELQGQLGERLAGAVVKFAEANGSSLQKLQKDLRDGTVGLDQVIKFAKKLNIDFADTAIKISNSSADAGQRLKLQMDNLKLAVGEAVLPIGAAFQTMFSEIVEGITSNQESLDLLGDTFRFIGGAAFTTVAAVRFLIRTLADLVKITYQVSQLDFEGAFKTATKGIEDTSANFVKDMDTIFNKIDIFSTKQGKPKINKISASQFDNRRTVTGGGLATLTGDIDGKEKEKLEKINLGLQRGILLKQTEDETDRKILERKYKFIDAIKEAKGIDDEAAQADRIALETKDFIIDKQNILNDALEKGKEKAFSFKDEFKKIADSAQDLNSRVGEIAINSVNKLGDSFVELAMTGKASFGDLARSILADLQRMILKALFFKSISNFLPSGLSKFLPFAKGGVVKDGEVVENAMGNVFAKNKVVPYAMGGTIVRKPSVFPMANGGVGLMAEAGYPEAIMPLKRGSDGKLGVHASGGGIGNIVVNVDASGSSVQGNQDAGKELGRVISASIQSELIRQKRPGGLLA